jgi:hypothetical protein
MKKNILIFFSAMLLAMTFVQTTNAQSNKEETEFMQSIFGMEKKAIVAEFLKLKVVILSGFCMTSMKQREKS